ncbi:MAG TPA: hypothetical protein VJL35_03520 [Gemmatimonadaceae bacterium]|nr:hypothetical protein [Gemmatimonadaceae bacterium]
MKSLLFLSALAVSVAPASTSTAARNVEILGVDYAFKVPATLPAGATTFTFNNAGKHPHEFNIFLLKRGARIEQVVSARKEGKSQLIYIDGSVGVLFADDKSKAPARLSANLLPDRDYGVLCIFRDSAKAPQHFEMGMYSVIHVTGSAAPVPRTPVDSIVAVDYAFTKYPREVSPGIHTISFRNAGKHRHEINIALLRKGVTLDSVVAVDKVDGDVFPLFEKNGGIGVLYSDAGKAPLGNLVIDFLPGRAYVLECGFQDDDKSPPHYKLGMYGSIKVRTQKR